jgi:hypothetical protein
MDGVYIAWNPTNWITIVLMAALGFMILGFVAQAWNNYRTQ